MGDELTVVHFVRHGEVDNPTGQLYGRQEGFHLTDLGRAMADRVAERFDGRDVRLVVSSPARTRTGRRRCPTARRRGLPVVLDADLIEAGNKFEGVNVNRNRLVLAHPRYWPWYANPFKPSWASPTRTSSSACPRQCGGRWISRTAERRCSSPTSFPSGR